MSRQVTREPAGDDARFESLGRLARSAAQPAPADELRAACDRFLDAVDPPRRRRAPLVLAGGLTLALVAALVVGRVRAPTGYEITPPPVGAGAVGATLAGGTLVRFHDGSELELQGAARGRLAEVNPAGARMVLEEGGLRVRVTPRRGARWVIAAGPFEVKVTGTAFVVRWSSGDGRLDLEMSGGRVVVSGPRFEQPLVAGQRLVATVDEGIVNLGANVDPPAPPPPAEGPRPPPAPVSQPVRGRAAAVVPDAAQGGLAWSRRVAAGDFGSVVAQAEAEGIEVALRRRGLADLQALATAARLAHRPELARRVFLVARARFARSEAAREAAFHLGRLAEDLDDDRGAAVAWYDRYLAENPAGLLAAEALGRKMVALYDGRAGAAQGRAAAEEAARQYLDRFAGGAHAGFARRVLDAR